MSGLGATLTEPRPDITLMADWALKINYSFIYRQDHSNETGHGGHEIESETGHSIYLGSFLMSLTMSCHDSESEVGLSSSSSSAPSCSSSPPPPPPPPSSSSSSSSPFFFLAQSTQFLTS